MSFYKSAKIILSPLIKLIFGVKTQGIENVPKDIPIIICSNHRSNYDPVILGVALPCELKYMAKAELFRVPFLSGLIKLLGAFPVKRGKNDTQAIKKAIELIKNGGVLAMFPEGHRQKQGDTLQRFHSGAALIAHKAHAAIIPVAIVTKGPVRPFKRNTVRIGKPLLYNELGFTDGGADNLRDVSSVLRSRVEVLINEKSRR